MMPVSRPCSTTGTWRNLPVVIRSMIELMVSDGVQVTTLRVITAVSGTSSAWQPRAASIATMSRSDTMPTTRCSGPVTTSAPIRRSARILAACSRLGGGLDGDDVAALGARMAFTVMGRSLVSSPVELRDCA